MTATVCATYQVLVGDRDRACAKVVDAGGRSPSRQDPGDPNDVHPDIVPPASGFHAPVKAMATMSAEPCLV